MSELDYELENQKEHVNIGLLLYQDSEKDQIFVASLELFGNGFDITIYDNDEPQYVNRCVVRNPSYEFLQHTDDNERVVVRVNTELFVMTEQQFEIIKLYYDMLNNNASDSVIRAKNYKTASQYFEENDEAYYIYEALLDNPQNIRIRVKLIVVLFDEIHYPNRSKTYGDLLKYMDLAEESLLNLVSLKSGRDKRLNFTKILCLSQLGMLSAYKGEIDSAIKYWYQSIENAIQSTAKENYTFKNIIGANVLNIMCFLNFLGEEYLADKLRLKFSNEVSFYVKNAIRINEKVNNDFENSPNSTDPGHREFRLKRNAQIQALTKNKNNDVFVLIEFTSDDYEAFFNEEDDPTYDNYDANYLQTMSIADELINGTYSTIFEKDENERKKQLLRIKAYL